MPKVLMGSVPPMYLIISLEQHCPPAQSVYLATGKILCVLVSVCVCLWFCIYLSDCLKHIQFSLPGCMIDFCLALLYKKIGSVNVYKPIAMATKAASKHLYTQLSPFFLDVGLAALPPVPKHS